MAAFLALGIASTSVASSAATIHIRIQTMVFTPDSVTAQVGDTVVWDNADIFPHTASASKHFDSGQIEAGKSFQTVVKKAGVINYLCLNHPSMKGKLVVVQAAKK
jgi:plastocyanin